MRRTTGLGWLCRLGLLPFLASILVGSLSAFAQQSFFQFAVTNGVVQFSLQTNASVYYVIKESPDLKDFQPIAIVLGFNGLKWDVPVASREDFFLLSQISIFSPTDTLGDGIDDVFKLENNLDPLNSYLYLTNSGHFGSGGIPLDWLHYYNAYFGRVAVEPENYGREVSVFNSGTPFGSADAISREVAVFNFGQAFGSADALSREVSIYNGQEPPLVAVPREVYSREVSAFNFGVPSAPIEAISRELSVYNGQLPPLVAVPQESYSREVSVFNTGGPSAPVEAISREVSVFNNVLN